MLVTSFCVIVPDETDMAEEKAFNLQGHLYYAYNSLDLE